MNILILQGSPRKHGNTKQLSVPLADEFQKLGCEVKEEWIYYKDIHPCMGCGHCQDVIGEVGCIHNDDFAGLINEMLWADLTIISTPIYAWFPPGPVKTFWDRLMYAPIKFYGKQKAPSMLRGKSMAVLITGGFDPKQIILPFETAVTRLCAKHEISYLGWVGGTDPGKGKVFMNEKKEQRVRSFADTLVAQLNDKANRQEN